MGLLFSLNALQGKIGGKNSYNPYVQINVIGAQLIRNNLSAANSPSVLVDGSNTTGYGPGSAGQNYYPFRTVVDLLGTYTISTLKYYDVGGGSTYNIYYGSSISSFTLVQTVTLTGGGFKTIQINQNCTFLQLELLSGTGPSEIQVYGLPVTINPVPPITLPSSRTFVNMYGVNANTYAPDKLFQPGSTVRQYTYLEEPWALQTQLLFSPTPQNELWDDLYKSRADNGINAFPVVFHTASWYQAAYVAAGQSWNTDTAPVRYGDNRLLPASWDLYGLLGYQYALRYGRTTVSLTNSTVNTTTPIFGTYNTKKTALNSMAYLEFTNELDRWFTSTAFRNQSVEPLEFAAMMSAIYDGHNGSMALCGVKTADPTMKVVMGAIADMNVDYFKIAYYWSKANRSDQKVPFDVFNFHYYTTTGGGQYQGGATSARCPEADNIKQRIIDFTDFILRYSPTTEVWWTEFGFDTNTQSAVGIPGASGVPSVPGFNTWQIQFAWTLRTFLEGMSTQRITKYIYYEMFNEVLGGSDNNEVPNFNQSGFLSSFQFQTSGFTLSIAAYITATSSAINLASVTIGTSVTFTRTTALWDTLYFKPGDTFVAYDPANQYTNRLTLTVTSYSGTTLIGVVSAIQGSGTFSTWTIGTPFAKKLAWYGMDNFISICGNLKYTADLSTGSYRLYKWSDGTTRDAYIIWSPTQNNTILTSQTFNIGRNNAILKDLESQTGASSPMTVTFQTVTVNVTEMPKLIYSDYAVTTYSLTVNSGTGSGNYASGSSVSIVANAPSSGMVFSQWTGNTSGIANVNSASTTITTQAANAVITATYVPITYALTVNSGSGSGNYASGIVVNIVANTAPSGYTFSNWSGSSGIANVNAASTTFTMSASAASITANYVQVKYALTVNSGSGSGTYAAGTSVPIVANTPGTGLIFDQWTGATTGIVSLTSSSTTIVTQASTASITATYKSSGGTIASTWVNTSYVSPKTGDSIALLVRLPIGYDGIKTFKGCVFLHGQGEKTFPVGSSNFTKLKGAGLAKSLDTGLEIDYVVVCPQTAYPDWDNIGYNADGSTKYPNVPGLMADEIATWLIANYKVDSTHMVITGLSMGGNGTYNALTNYPTRWSAAIPMSTVGPGSGNFNKVKCPVWQWHGDNDTVQGTATNCKNTIDSINAAGIVLDAQYTIVKNCGGANTHCTHAEPLWSKAYSNVFTSADVVPAFPASATPSPVFDWASQYKMVGGVSSLG